VAVTVCEPDCVQCTCNDTLPLTSTGLDSILAWLLCLSAPTFCKPKDHLFNLSLSSSFVPPQWKRAWISPIPEVSRPMAPVDFRPISTTPILSRIMERLVVRQFLYPAFRSSSPESLVFSDQFAFRPTGFSTSALVWFLHAITQLLTEHDYVIVLALDFSKAFDTVFCRR